MDGNDDDDEANAQAARQEEQEAAAQAEEGSIVVDRDDLRSDDGYESDSRTSASTSLAEGIRDYIYENGRRYHRFREGRYNFPNDDVEFVPPVLSVFLPYPGERSLTCNGSKDSSVRI